MANKNSTLYANLFVNKYVGDARDYGGRAVPLPFEHTVASDGSTDTVNLTVIPANAMVVGLEVANEALGTSTTMALGDSGSSGRYLVATAVTSAGKNNGLLSAGQNYRPSVDTILLLTWAAATPTNGAIVKGVLWIIPGQ